MNSYHASATMEYCHSSNNSFTTDGMIGHHYQHQQPSHFSATPGMNQRAIASTGNSNAETQVSEALLTLSSVAAASATKTPASASEPPRNHSSHPPLAPQQYRPAASAPSAPRRVSLCSPTTAGYAPPQWPQPYVPPAAKLTVGTYETPKRAASPVLYHVEIAPPAKKVRTVSPINAPANVENLSSCVSCVCPVCNQQIKGLGDQKVDWSQPIQGRQRAKTITAIKKHVKENHDDSEPLWNVIVNSLDVTPSRGNDDAIQRVVTAQAFVHQALKKSALDSIPNQPNHLRSLRWTEKMIDQRVGIALGFVMYGGHEFLRGKKCTDEQGQQINPKSLRNLAYSFIRGMHQELMNSLAQNERYLQESMNRAPLGLLRNRFQLLFAAPDKWSESWYMDPTKYKC